MLIEFGDIVKFKKSPTTEKAGVSEQQGKCLGWTTPSQTKIEFIGDQSLDYAILVELDETSEIIWATQDLVEFVSHGEGQVMEIGNKRATRMADGSWKEEIIDPSKERVGWFKRLFGKNK